MVSMQPTGNQTMTQREADQFLTEARMAPTTKSPRILGINQIPLMRAKSNGYPIDMHHPTLQMRQAMKEEEELALSGIGYQRGYIVKEYPKVLFRRNMATTFEPRFDPATNIQISDGFVEERMVRDEKHEKELRSMKVRPGISDWFARSTDIPEIEGAAEDTDAMKIARLQGRLEATESAQLPGVRGRRRS
jgi:hypothetical protein